MSNRPTLDLLLPMNLRRLVAGDRQCRNYVRQSRSNMTATLSTLPSDHYRTLTADCRLNILTLCTPQRVCIRPIIITTRPIVLSLLFITTGFTTNAKMKKVPRV